MRLKSIQMQNTICILPIVVLFDKVIDYFLPNERESETDNEEGYCVVISEMQGISQ